MTKDFTCLRNDCKFCVNGKCTKTGQVQLQTKRIPDSCPSCFECR